MIFRNKARFPSVWRISPDHSRHNLVLKVRENIFPRMDRQIVKRLPFEVEKYYQLSSFQGVSLFT